MKRREFLQAALVLACGGVLTRAEEPELVRWDGVPVPRRLARVWDSCFPGSGVVLPEEAATAAILAGESRREVLVAAPADASLAVLTAWVIALATEAQPQSGQRLTPLRMYLSRQRPDTVRLVTYVL